MITPQRSRAKETLGLKIWTCGKDLAVSSLPHSEVPFPTSQADSETHTPGEPIKDGGDGEQAEPKGRRDVEQTHETSGIGSLELGPVRSGVQAQVGHRRLDTAEGEEEEEDRACERRKVK